MVWHGPAILGNALSRFKRTMMAWYTWCCVILASCISMLHCVAVGQTTSTETKWIEEADAHIQLPSQWRVLAFVGGEQGQN
jgi:hypothetical protein